LVSGAHLIVVTNEQLYMVIGIPLISNAAMIVLLMAWVNAKFEGQNSRFEGRFDSIDAKFAAIDKRFDDMRDLWRAELRRVEEVLGARLKHIEERH
jgi:hypothetical protein